MHRLHREGCIGFIGFVGCIGRVHMVPHLQVDLRSGVQRMHREGCTGLPVCRSTCGVHRVHGMNREECTGFIGLIGRDALGP